MTSATYLEHVVPVLRDWMRNEEIETGQPHYLVQDNDPSHVAKATLAQMKDWQMRWMDHPPASPDLNLAENPIGQMKYNIVNRRRTPTTPIELEQAIRWEWDQYDQAKLAHLVARFPRRLRAVQAAHGGPSRY
jgi:hypothetical protein